MSDTSVAGDSFTLTEAHHIRCRELSCQLGYERRGVVCHVMQDLCGCRCFLSPQNSRQHSARRAPAEHQVVPAKCTV